MDRFSARSEESYRTPHHPCSQACRRWLHADLLSRDEPNTHTIALMDMEVEGNDQE
jgi:hypothetical protein